MTPDSEILIRLENIGRWFPMGDEQLQVLKGISLDIKHNEYIAIVGSSGSGKSTLMNILGCLDTPSSGRYWLDGEEVENLTGNELARIRNQEIGFVFQSFNLLPRESALKNVMQPLIYAGIGLKERKRRATEMLDRVGLAERMNHLPAELSGGQKQRVAIARAMVTQPSLILADEPTGNLDSSTSQDIMKLFDEMHNEGQTLILVTHEPDIAGHCNRIIRLHDGEVASDDHQEGHH